MKMLSLYEFRSNLKWNIKCYMHLTCNCYQDMNIKSCFIFYSFHKGFEQTSTVTFPLIWITSGWQTQDVPVSYFLSCPRNIFKDAWCKSIELLLCCYIPTIKCYEYNTILFNGLCNILCILTSSAPLHLMVKT